MRIASLAALSITLLMASSAGAGRSSNANLEFNPSAATAWGWAYGSGCGYAADSQVSIAIHKPEALAFRTAMPDAEGCISFTFTTDGVGTYLVEARQQTRNRWRLIATYQLPVL